MKFWTECPQCEGSCITEDNPPKPCPKCGGKGGKYLKEITKDDS